MTTAWLIEYRTCSRPCWIADAVVKKSFGVTYAPGLARRFNSKQEADEEIKRLGLKREWEATERTLAAI